MKGQATIDYTMLYIPITIAIALFVIVYISLFHPLPSTISLQAYNFQITSFTSNSLQCGFGFSFDSQLNMSVYPLTFKLESSNGSIITLNYPDVTGYSANSPYLLETGLYHYTYPQVPSNTFNSTICSMFTTYPQSNTGSILSLTANNNNAIILLNLPQKTRLLKP
jgi:hypothetical protein